MVSASLMPAGEANRFPPRLWPSAPDPRALRAPLTGRLNLGRAALNSLLIAGATTVDLGAVQLDGRLCLRQARVPRPRPALPLLVAALVIPGQVAMLPLFLMLKEMG